MIRHVESVRHIFASVSPFLVTLLIKPSGIRGVLTAGAGAVAGVAGVLTAGVDAGASVLTAGVDAGASVLSAGAGAAGLLTAGEVTVTGVEGDAVWISSVYPGSEQPTRDKTVTP